MKICMGSAEKKRTDWVYYWTKGIRNANKPKNSLAFVFAVSWFCAFTSPDGTGFTVRVIIKGFQPCSLSVGWMGVLTELFSLSRLLRGEVQTNSHSFQIPLHGSASPAHPWRFVRTQLAYFPSRSFKSQSSILSVPNGWSSWTGPQICSTTKTTPCSPHPRLGANWRFFPIRVEHKETPPLPPALRPLQACFSKLLPHVRHSHKQSTWTWLTLGHWPR